MSSRLLNALTTSKQIVKLSNQRIFTISKRQVHFQDTLFGLENQMNLQRILQYEKSAGPSMLMNAEKYGFDLPFFVDANSVQGNDDTTRVFGLNTIKSSPDIYCDFPRTVFSNTQLRNGLFEVSLQSPENTPQWNPKALINYVADNGLEKTLKLSSSDLFKTYLTKPERSPKLTDEQILEMYRAIYVKNAPELPKKWIDETFVDGNPSGDLTEKAKKSVLEIVKNADPSLPSFTDVEFGYFFLKLKAEQRYNMSVVTAGGHLIKTEEIAVKLNELLELKTQKKEDDFNNKLQEFMELTKGDEGTPNKSEKIVSSLKTLPLFNEIYKQNSSFMERNFEAFCIKLDAYSLNRIKPSEALVVIMQLPFVFDRAPYYIPFVFQYDETEGFIITELLCDEALSALTPGKPLDPRIAKTIKYCGTPSANIFVTENPDDLISGSMDLMKEYLKKSKLSTDPVDLASLRQDYLYELTSNEMFKFRRLNGLPVRFAAKENDWLSRHKAMSDILTSSILQNDKAITDQTPHKIVIREEIESVGGDGLEAYVTYEEKVPVSADYYNWRPILTVEIPKNFSTNRKLNNLPEKFPQPVEFPEHIGAASPLNPLTTNGTHLTAEEYNKIK